MEISLEGMMLKLKLQYFGHLMRRVDSLEKTLMLGGIGGRGNVNWCCYSGALFGESSQVKCIPAL